MSRPPAPETAVLLRPGVRVLRRDPTIWQFGPDPSRSLLVPASAQIDPLVESVAVAPTLFPATPEARRLFRTLVDRDLLIDAGLVTRSVVTDLRSAQALSAVLARHGDDTPELLTRRARVGVRVHGTTPDLAELRRILAPTGIEVAADAGRRPVQVAVVVCVGELSRTALDDLVRESRPHLVLRAVDGRAVVGPFVVPGHSACLRCIDAYRSESDPHHALLVERYAAGSGPRRADGVADPVDPALWALAMATAANDVLRYADGRQPVTWSSTRSFGSDDDEPQHTRWRRHPRCGCSWADALVRH